MKISSFCFIILNLLVAALAVDRDTSPSQIHIALAGVDENKNSNSMTISWSTVKNTVTTTVRYGKKNNLLTEEATGISVSYWKTFHHHVVLPNLEPNTEYFYQAGDITGGFSDILSFKSAPLSGSKHDVKFAVFGDLGFYVGNKTTEYLSSVKNQLDLIVHSGDVGYADDSFLHQGCVLSFCYEDAFDNYMNSVQDWASTVPYMVGVGNHEAECHDPSCLTVKKRRDTLSNFTAYNKRFRMPSNESKGVLNMWYSFNYANAHFIMVDTETGYPGASEETRYVLPCGGFGDHMDWLEQDLIAANADRVNRPWVFAVGHHPMYQGGSINTDLQAAMEELFYNYGVDIFFTGHEHSYERDYPVYGGVTESTGTLAYVNPRATTHLMIGGAGNDEMSESTEDPPLLGMDELGFIHPEGNGKWRSSKVKGTWTALTDENHVGIGIVQIIDDSTLQFDYVRTADGSVFDTITLTRDHSIFTN